MRIANALMIVLLVSAGWVPSAAAQNWTMLDPENVIVIDTNKGRIVIEARPDIAPLAVARVKALARGGVYDGLLFHRVVEHFVVQTGNPNNKDGGTSTLPNLPPEFVFRLKPTDVSAIAATSSDAVSGFLGSVPFVAGTMAEAARSNDGTVRAWGAYCPGVAGMGRQAARDSSNSEIFFMLEASRRLDRDYTVWGRIIDGFPVLQALNVGSPPPTPDVMQRVRVLSDFPASERFDVSVASQAVLAALIAAQRRDRGADFSVCDVNVPAQIVPR